MLDELRLLQNDIDNAGLAAVWQLGYSSAPTSTCTAESAATTRPSASATVSA